MYTEQSLTVMQMACCARLPEGRVGREVGRSLWDWTDTEASVAFADLVHLGMLQCHSKFLECLN